MEAKLKNRKKGPTTRSKAAAEIQKENNLLGKGIGGTKLGANEEADEDDEDAEDDGAGGEPGEVKPVSANQKSLRELIERRPPRLSKEEEESMVIHTGQKIPTKKSKWRQLGASTIKFEFVLTLTKNIVPLIMILVMGEVRRSRFVLLLCKLLLLLQQIFAVVVSLWFCSDLSSVTCSQ